MPCASEKSKHAELFTSPLVVSLSLFVLDDGSLHPLPCMMASRKRRPSQDDTYTDHHYRSAAKRRNTWKPRQRRSDSLSEADTDDDDEPETQVLTQRSIDPDRYWTAETILDEDRTRYRIKWEGIDPKTGRPYEPTW